MVVALAELVGVLEAVGAAAQWAGEVALPQNMLVDLQATENFGPAPVRATFDVVDTGGVLRVLHGSSHQFNRMAGSRSHTDAHMEALAVQQRVASQSQFLQ